MKMTSLLAAASFVVAGTPILAETSIRATGLVSTHKFHTALEQEFYAGLSENRH